MIAFTPDRGTKRVESDAEVLAEFGAFDTYFLLEDDAGAALLATGEGFGRLALEWFPAARAGFHLKASEELRRDEVLAAMLAFRGGEPGWRDRHGWVEVEDRRPGWIERFVTGRMAGPRRGTTAE